MQQQVIGRAPELAAVDRMLTRAASGSGMAALTLQGEPGIGKTTVWEAARSEAVVRGYQVLSARPTRSESGLPLGAFGDLFSDAFANAAGGLPSPQRDALAVALLLAEPVGMAHPQRALSVATATLLRVLTEGDHPVLLAIDDVQWLDESSAAVLAHALRRVQDRAIGVVLSLRGSGASATPLGLDVSGQTGWSEHLMLGPLSLAALHRMLEARAGESFPRLALVKIEAASAGNAFYALEIARALIRSGVRVAAGERLPIPATLAALTSERLNALPVRTRDALLVTAVAFEPTLEVLARAAGADLVSDLEPALHDGVVALDSETVRFSHPLLAAAALSRAGPARIREIHSTLAEAGCSDEARARHLGLAALGQDPLAAAALEAAAERARLRGAPVTAAEMLERARDLTPATDQEEAARRAYEAAVCYAEAGVMHQAWMLLGQVMETQPTGIARARVLQRLGQVRAWSASFPEALELALQALQACEGDVALRAEIELDAVFCHISIGDYASAEAHARAAVADAEMAGPDGAKAEALAILTIIEFFGGHGVNEARMARALALEDPLRAGPVQMRPRVIRALLLLFTGRLGDAIATMTELIAEASERGQESAIPMVSFYLVWACVWRGDLQGAVRVAVHSRDVAQLNNDPSMQALSLTASALAAAHTGAVDRARAEADEALALFQGLQWTLGTIWPLWALGFLELSVGNAQRVDVLLHTLADAITRMGFGEPILGVFLPDEVEALVALGDVDSAVRLVDWLEQCGRRVDRPWALATAARGRGIIAAAQGDLQSALGALDQAIVEHGRLSMPLELARTLLVKGQVHRRRREKRLANQALRESLRLFDEAGAALWAARVSAELARVGLRPQAPTDLTETERRVATLAAAGMTNRQVAQAAFISPKTVDNVLARVYRKLAITSRAQLGVALGAMNDEAGGGGASRTVRTVVTGRETR
ncbi:MAG: AAA family ATPase [Candidatus Dormibacteria bacterium]